MRIWDLATILREDGPSWLAWRLWYEVQLRWFFPHTLPPVVDVGEPLASALKVEASELDTWLFEAWQERGGAFFVDGDRPEPLRSVIADPRAVLDLADRALKGEWRFFSNEWRQLGFPPNWYRGQRDETNWRSDSHWSRLPDLSPELGDIKYVWEPARFTHVFGLARAWMITGDQRYPEAFWKLTEDWLDQNSPELGPHWRCAQEMALRSMAWIFGLYTFRNCQSTSPRRVARLIKALWYHAYHIDKVHWYAAKCVRNNHAISEAAGLFTIGTLFPFLPHAAHWKRVGGDALAEELSWQVYDDGAYVQHSMNYARFAVQVCTWATSLSDLNGGGLPDSVRSSATRLLRFLTALQDPVSGRVPNYGSNDGALIFPLSSCDYLDYRPALNALAVALDGRPLYDMGPWAEESAWFSGIARTAGAVGPKETVSVAFPHGGYFALRGQDTHAIVRCATYRHRPAQADMLHLDIWYGGHNVLVDPGTYSYNAEQPWSRHFVGTAAHNTVSVDQRDQMRKGSRFMWHNWTKSRLLAFRECDGRVVFSGEHSGYAPITHRRSIVLENRTYLVLDELVGSPSLHEYRLHWLLNDFAADLLPDGVTLHVPDVVSGPLRLAVVLEPGDRLDCVRAKADGEPRGWQSLYYGSKSPASSLEVVRTGIRVAFITLLGPKEHAEQLLALGQEQLASLIRHACSPTSTISL